MSTIPAESRAELVRYLTTAEDICVFTGAGISTNSGIPDFRGPKGVWKTRKPVFFQDFMAEEAKRHEYWLMKSEDWQGMRQATPTPTHLAIAALHEAGKLAGCITQNIDGLHVAAGLPPEAQVEVHGSNAVAECMGCGVFFPADPLYDQYLVDQRIPHCTLDGCDAVLKPGVISFGQSLRSADLERATEFAMGCDLVIALGSTLSVNPAAAFPILAARNGIPYVVINLGPTEHDGTPWVTLRIEGELDAVFPAAVDDALAMSG